MGWTRASFVVVLTVTLSRCGGCASGDDLAFCDAVSRRDFAAAETLLGSGRVGLFTRNLSGTCQPGLVALDASPRSPEHTALAIRVARQQGVANTSFTPPTSSSRRSGGAASGAIRPLQLAIGNANAIELGNLSMLRALLRGGARINDARGPRWQPPIHLPLEFCGPPPEGPGENDVYRVTLLRTIVEAGASATAKNSAGQTPIDRVTANLAQQTHPFYIACQQAKLDYLRSASGAGG